MAWNGGELDVVERAMARLAILEDVGEGDLTAGLIPAAAMAVATMRAREDGILSGTGVAREVFRAVDPEIEVDCWMDPGQRFKPGDRILSARGSAAGPSDRRAVRLELPAASLRDRQPDFPFRRRSRWDGGADLGHAQDGPGTPSPCEGGGAPRRRSEPSARPVRCHHDQGQSHRSRGGNRGGRLLGAFRTSRDADHRRGEQPRRGRGSGRAGRGKDPCSTT